MSIIHIDGDDLLAKLDEHGWTQGKWTDDEGAICAHQAIRLCSPVPGDAYLIEAVAGGQGWGTAWNDDESTTEADVRARLAAGVDVTDADLAETFGPQWRAVVALVRRAARLTEDECRRLAAARDAASAAARDAWVTATRDAWDAARAASAAWAAWSAARAARAAWAATRAAAGDAAWVAATWDLATADGPYTITHRDLLVGPWAEVCGLPEGLLDEVER